jgi:hypothetical protein
MTIAVAWTRTVANTHELLVASDSRLSGGGGYIDICQKVFPLGRGDVAIAFCGTTSRAYPVVHQIINFVNNSPKAMSRGQDITDLKGAIISVVNNFRDSYQQSDTVDVGDDDQKTLFLLSGFSWKLGRYAIYTLHFDASAKGYTFRPAGSWGGQRMVAPERGKRIAAVGDHISAFKAKLRDLLNSRGRLGVGGFGMEPLEVLSDMLGDNSFTQRTTQGTGLIGGAPQLVKIYRYGAALSFAVEWREGRYLLGRKLLPFEKTLNPIITLPSLDVRYPLDSVAN